MSRNYRKYAIAAAGGLMLFMVSPALWADEFRLVPGAAVMQEFSDNLFYSYKNKQSSFISTASPLLSLIDRTERLDAKFDARLDLLFYTANSQLNSVDQRYKGQATYQLTPCLALAGKAGFDRVNRPDSYLEKTGQVSILGSNKQDYSLEGDLTLTERWAGSLGYEYEQVNYFNRTIFNGTISDYRTHNVTLGTVYDMSNLLPMLKLRGNLGFGTYDFGSLRLDQYTATIGFGYNFHELWSVQADAGSIYTHSHAMEQISLTRTEEHNTDSLGWIGSLVFAYKGEKDSASLNFSRSVQGSYGNSGAVERTSVTLDLWRRFTYELSGRVGGGYYLNKTGQNQLAFEAVDETTYRSYASLRYEFNRDVNVDCNYEYALLKDHLAWPDLWHVSGTEARRNMVFIRLTAQWPFFE